MADVCLVALLRAITKRVVMHAKAGCLLRHPDLLVQDALCVLDASTIAPSMESATLPGRARMLSSVNHDLELLQGLVDLDAGGAQEEFRLLCPQVLHNLYWFEEL